MRCTKNSYNRVLATVLAVIMIVACVPLYVFAGTRTGASSGGDDIFASVTSLVGGNVTGSGEKDVSVVVEDTTLEWFPADSDMGRESDGWWVGFDVTAPEGFDTDNSKYVVKNDPEAEYDHSKAKLFDDFKNEDDKVEFWFPVSPEGLTKLSEEGKMFTVSCIFDWNADETYEQEVTLTLDPKGDTLLKKGEYQFYPDVTAPFVYFVKNTDRKTVNEPVSATIYIIERIESFNADDATESIIVTDRAGNELTEGFEISEWVTEKVCDEYDIDQYVHTATVKFVDSAEYVFDIEYSDRNGIECEDVDEWNFIIDYASPVASINVEDASSDTVEVSISDISDNFSAEESIKAFYANADDETVEAVKINSWNVWDKEPIEILSDDLDLFYVMLIDEAGNTAYLSNEGVVFEDNESTVSIAPNGAFGFEDDKYFYNSECTDYTVDVRVNEYVAETDTYNGIKEIKYWFYCGGEIVGDFVYLSEEGNESIYDEAAAIDIKAHFEAAGVSLDSPDIELWVQATDTEGNVYADFVYIDVDTIAPMISVSYDGVTNEHTMEGYYQSATATVTIVERDDHFDEEVAKGNIQITAKDSKGEDAVQLVEIGQWTHEKNSEDTNLSTHTLTISYKGDAEYTFDIDYTDTFGNAADDYEGDSFIVDNTCPTGTVTAKSKNTGRVTEDDVVIDSTWNSLADSITFELWTNAKVNITGTSADEMSDVKSVAYYKSDSIAAMSESDLDALAEGRWKSFSSFDITPNQQAVIYVRIIDKAGNITYISTNGIIVDNMDPAVKKLLPNISVTPAPSASGVYNGDVTVSVEVAESVFKDVYSGIKKITYVVKNMGVETQSGTLYEYNKTGSLKSDLITEWSDDKAVVISAAKNNSNDVVVEICAVDNAGNSHKTAAAVKIDATAPVIDITYDNNDSDKSYDESVYFNADRTATITVTERNFDVRDLRVTIANKDGKVPKISAFTTVTADGNGDGSKHTAKIVYSADGDYTFNIAYIDKANNKAAVNHHSDASTSFTIDKTAPVVKVTFDNNKGVGGIFNGQRTATIVVTEHNFDPERFVVDTMGQRMSSWRSNGDLHTARITYSANSKFTLDFECTDKAGNKSADFKPVSFTIDTQKPELDIIDNVHQTGIDEPAVFNKNVSFDIVYSDIHVDGKKVTVKLENSEGKDLSSMIKVQDKSQNGNKVVKLIEDTFEQAAIPDGIYTLTVTVYDTVGNSETKVKEFSVNRKASRFMVGESLKELLELKYVSEVTKNVTLSVINCTEVTETEVAVIRNGVKSVLKEGTDYTISEKTYNPGAWFRYDIEIKAAVFAESGNYSIVIKTVDKAGNTVDNLTTAEDYQAVMEFAVDNVAPTVTISGIDNISSDAETVDVIIGFEDNVGVDSVTVMLFNEKGEMVGTPTIYFTQSTDVGGRTLDADFDMFTFTVESGRDWVIKVEAEDKVGNDVSVETEKFTVSSGLWDNYPELVVIFSVMAVVVVAAAVSVVIILIKGKKDNK